MKIDTRLEDRMCTIVPFGSIDSTTADQLDATVAKLNLDELDEISFDFENVDYISSKCLRILVSLLKRTPGKKISLSNLNATVSDIINLSGLTPLFVLK